MWPGDVQPPSQNREGIEDGSREMKSEGDDCEPVVGGTVDGLDTGTYKISREAVIATVVSRVNSKVYTVPQHGRSVHAIAMMPRHPRHE